LRGKWPTSKPTFNTKIPTFSSTLKTKKMRERKKKRWLNFNTGYGHAAEGSPKWRMGRNDARVKGDSRFFILIILIKHSFS